MGPGWELRRMLDGFRWLGLEVKYLDSARAFYGDLLDLPVVGEKTDEEVRVAAGGHEIRLRRPTGQPRGGLHTHFAFATPPDHYEAWWDRLSEAHDLQEHTFGSARALYLYDPDGNCVEIGQRGETRGDSPPELTGIFEVVLEVADLERAEALYADLGFETVDRGKARRRVRMNGPFELELWEPQLGIADARGGVHVDLGLEARDPAAAAEVVDDRVCEIVNIDEGVRIRDPDGHWLTVHES